MSSISGEPATKNAAGDADRPDQRAEAKRATMAKRTKSKSNGIYALDTSDIWGASVLDIKHATFFVERAPSVREDTWTILKRKEERIPFGPRSYPFEASLLTEFGVGSGFARDTPRLHAEFDVPGFKDERPIRDLLWGGDAFRMGAWIVTERFKAVLEGIDPKGWEFWPVSTSFHTKTMSTPGPIVWLCELVRGVRAMDDAYGPREVVGRMSQQELRFRCEDIGRAPFFRDPQLFVRVFCSEETRARLAEANITGLTVWMAGEQYD